MVRHRIELDTRTIADIAVNTPPTLEPSLQGRIRHTPGTTLRTREETPRPPY